MNSRIIDKSIPVWQLSIYELESVISGILDEKLNNRPAAKADTDNIVSGIKNIAKVLGCSTRTVHEKINRGDLDNCIKRYGKVVVLDKNKLLNDNKKR